MRVGDDVVCVTCVCDVRVCDVRVTCVLALAEALQPRFTPLPCGGLGVDSDTVWNEAYTPHATRMVSQPNDNSPYSLPLTFILYLFLSTTLFVEVLS